MKYCLITFRSITYAQQGERVLHKAGIDCILIRTPKHLQERGCGYCLKIRAGLAPDAVENLQRGKINYGKCYILQKNGQAEEQEL